MIETELATQVTSLISSVGFPIVVAWYMLTKGSKDSKELKEAIDNQSKLIERLLQNGGR